MSSLKRSSLIVGSCAIVCLAAASLVQSQQIYDVESNSELGKLVRGQGRGHHQGRPFNSQLAGIQDQGPREFQGPAQPMQFAPTQHRRNFGNPSASANYGPTNLGAMASNGRPNPSSEMSNNDDDEGSNFGPNFGANFDSSDNDGDSPANANPNADSGAHGLDKAASGYPGHNQAEFNGNEGLNFDSQGAGFGPSSADGSDFGPSEGFDGRRAKAASSPMGSSGYAGEDDAGAPQYGPNSAINADSDAESEVTGRQPKGQYSGSQADSDDNDDE